MKTKWKVLGITALAASAVAAIATVVKKRRDSNRKHDLATAIFMQKLENMKEGPDGDYLVSFNGHRPVAADQIVRKRRFTLVLKRTFMPNPHEREELIADLAERDLRLIRFGSREAERIGRILLNEPVKRKGFATAP